MYDIIHQGNESYVPDETTNIMHNVYGHHQVPRFESNEISNVMETNLVSSLYEPQFQNSGELQYVTKDLRKVLAELKTNLQTPQVAFTSVSFRGRTCKMSGTKCKYATVWQPTKPLWPIILHVCLIYFLQMIHPQLLLMMEKDMRQNSNCKTGCAVQQPFMLKWW